MEYFYFLLQAFNIVCGLITTLLTIISIIILLIGMIGVIALLGMSAIVYLYDCNYPGSDSFKDRSNIRAVYFFSLSLLIVLVTLCVLFKTTIFGKDIFGYVFDYVCNFIIL